MRLLIDVGSCFMMPSGWFECLFMYSGSSFGFLYGLNFPLLRSKVTSKKFSTCKFASAVIFKPNCSKHLWSSFLVLSAKRAYLFFMIANPSSLYRPMFYLPNFCPRLFNMKRPTSSGCCCPFLSKAFRH